ncbi:MAG: hypothetical protein J5988_10830 [Eubacterium sp.]|nr:hypothetical protein [Eubacterium sp.]
MRIQTKVENGKAYLEFDLKDETEKAVLIQIQDGENKEVFRCYYPFSEEEPAKAILLHPHLWNGPEDPYLYKIIVHSIDSEGEITESQTHFLALRTLEEMEGKGWFLNGKPFEIRAVKWDAMDILKVRGVLSVLEELRSMGANALYLPEDNCTEEFSQICAEMGFVIFQNVEKLEKSLPACSQLFFLKAPFFTDFYYCYKARWSKESFVYLSMNSIRKNEKGTLSLKVYSNQKKVALYIDGVLFEFLTGGQEYLFEEIPVKKYPAVLTAEAGECRMAVTIYSGTQNFRSANDGV